MDARYSCLIFREYNSIVGFHLSKFSWLFTKFLWSKYL
uniref:Uncharacterized protein n=1 Tax=Rhizophora mucronata TaxID=61149 RepID=A0A2P2QPH1_RHIMU